MSFDNITVQIPMLDFVFKGQSTLYIDFQSVVAKIHYGYHFL